MAIQRILIVDDSPTERYYLTDILVRNGFTVSVAENGEEALAKIKADKPQLILMDVVMPGANGFQVTRSIARDPALQDVPVIICSSKNQETDRIWGLRQGARDYLVKPVDAADLLAKIAAPRLSDEQPAARPRHRAGRAGTPQPSAPVSGAAARTHAGRQDRRRRRRARTGRADRRASVPAGPTQISEIVPPQPVTPVPLARDWYQGLANIRGHLTGVIDLARYQGQDADDTTAAERRFITFAPALGFNCALLAGRVLGLRKLADMRAVADADAGVDADAAPAWCGQRFDDAEGQHWTRLDLAQLVREPRFLQVGL